MATTSPAGIRWGLDAEARAPYQLGGVDQNTWSFGLDRLLAGVAVSQDGPLLVGSALPVDDVGSGSIELVGALAEFQRLVQATILTVPVCPGASKFSQLIRQEAQRLVPQQLAARVAAVA